MTDARAERPAVTRRNLLRLGGAAIPAAALLGRGTTRAQAAPASLRLAERHRRALLPPRPRGAVRVLTHPDHRVASS
jgi:hypothetical protein